MKGSEIHIWKDELPGIKGKFFLSKQWPQKIFEEFIITITKNSMKLEYFLKFR